MKNLFLLLVFSPLFLLLSCENPPTLPTKKDSKKEKNIKKLMREVNRRVVKAEDQQIDSYAKRHHWKMKKTGDGLRYWIYQKNEKGEKISSGQTVEIAYSLNLINGDTIYTSSKKGLKSFVLGQGDEISGLEEGLYLLKKGERAKFIIPSHLAFGVRGDEEKIPMRASLIYDIQVINIK